MHKEYHKWYSPSMHRDMELRVYGHYGKPLIIIPTQGGSFHEAEDYHMINVLSLYINEGRIKVITVDSVDTDAWANENAAVHDRGNRHEQYNSYIMNEVIPFIGNHCNNPDIKVAITGSSMGAYHAANFFFRHPFVFDTVIAISGIYDLRLFIGDYVDETVYFNSPLRYLRNLNDEAILNQLRKNKIVIAVGQGAWEEEMIVDTNEMKAILEEKNVPAWIDFWGNDVDHDWTWWRVMLPYFVGKLF
ncbi:MAG: alpha/beta hydrolase-fold protein [Bacteroidales bacterium]|nr:alpha/beta hydrolase-fold protein [Bacteroidales bacterium]